MTLGRLLVSPSEKWSVLTMLTRHPHDLFGRVLVDARFDRNVSDLSVQSRR
jgi:hypothetical protein